jgi:transmembrane sensor
MVGELAHRQRRRQRRITIGSATAAALATAAVFVFVVRPFSMGAAHASAGETAQSVRVSLPERRQLADGSVVELKAGAQIVVHFSATQRDVRLVQGEALFTVAKNAARPFVVATGLAKVRAVGTAFAVGLRPQAVAVLVTEGTVAVERATSAAQASLPVSSGNALVVPNSISPDVPLRVEAVTADEIERRLAWRAPRLELSNTTVADIVGAFNRENRIQLAIADPKLAGLRLSGVFRADRPEDFIRLLESHYGVRVEQRGPGRIVLRRAQ